MIRSLRSREKMSNARSPRGVCSTTIGTKAIGRLLATFARTLFFASWQAATIHPTACAMPGARRDASGAREALARDGGLVVNLEPPISWQKVEHSERDG